MSSLGNVWTVNRIHIYATLPNTNPLFMGFSGYQNVNSSSQRDNIILYLGVHSIQFISPQNFGSGVFFMNRKLL